jgi:ABC-type branched-subunit amino acid transport system substrate-binding protein/class 3 adenylate cyclase
MVLHAVTSLLVLLSLTATTVLRADAQTNSFPITLCVTCRVARTPISLHAGFAARYYASEYPLLNVTVKLIGIYEPGGTTQRNLIRAYVANGTDCNVLIGPGASALAVAISPVMNTLWVDYSASATELSNRYDFPLFNRVMPSDDAATRGYKPLLALFDWRRITFICSDTAYGRSVVGGMSQALESIGGHATSSECLLPNADFDTALVQIQRIRRSGAKVVLIAMTTTDAAFSSVVNAIHNVSLSADTIVLFADSACSADSNWNTVAGAICMAYVVEQTAFAPFYSAYLAREMTRGLQAFEALGFPTSEVSLRDTSVYAAYAVDASRLALLSLQRFVSTLGRLPTSVEESLPWVRNTTFNGTSGHVAIPNGDRVSADMTIYNAFPQGQVVVVGNVSSVGVLSLGPEVFLLGRFIPSGLVASQTSTERGFGSHRNRDFPVTAIAIIAAVAGLLLIVVAAVTVKVVQKRRVTARCPTDATKPFSVIFLGVKNSAELWENCTPESVDRATAQLSRIVRKCSMDSDCHVARRVDDMTFMIVAKKASQAVDCATKLADELNVKTDWGQYLERSHEIVRAAALAGRPDDLTVCSARTSKRSSSRASSSRYSRRSDQRGAAGSNVAGNVEPAAEQVSGDGAAHKRKSKKAFELPRHLRQSSSRRTETIVLALRVNIGLNHGLGRIEDPHDQGEDDPSAILYHGNAVTVAAAAADAAVGGQIAVTEYAVAALDLTMDDFSGEERAALPQGAALTPYRRVTCVLSNLHGANIVNTSSAVGNRDSKSTTTEVQLFSYYPPNYAAADMVEDAIVASTAALVGHSVRAMDASVSNGSESGAIANALTRAECGVASRRVAAVVIHIPFLTNQRWSIAAMEGSFGKTLETLFAEIQNVVATFKVRLLEVAGARIIITVNAVGPVSVANPPVRACSVALALITKINTVLAPPADELAATAGVACCTAVVGSLRDRHVVLGHVVEWAHVAQNAARTLGLPCIATDGGYDEIVTKFNAATVDIVSVPRMVRNSRLAVPPPTDPAAVAPSGVEAPPIHLQQKPTRLIGVAEERSDDMGEEWLYAFESYARAEEPWTAFLRGEHHLAGASFDTALGGRSGTLDTLPGTMDEVPEESQQLNDGEVPLPREQAEAAPVTIAAPATDDVGDAAVPADAATAAEAPESKDHHQHHRHHHHHDRHSVKASAVIRPAVAEVPPSLSALWQVGNDRLSRAMAQNECAAQYAMERSKVYGVGW